MEIGEHFFEDAFEVEADVFAFVKLQECWKEPDSIGMASNLSV
jgi:hypothetical protein